MKEIAKVTLPILRITPGNGPNSEQWARVKDYPSAGDHTRIRIVENNKHGLVCREGNHRLAIITKNLGLFAVITVTQVEDDDDEYFWDDMVSEAREFGIHTFEDFWKAAIEGRFVNTGKWS